MKKIILLLTILSSSLAFSGEFTCEGTPRQVFIWKDGLVAVHLSGQEKVWGICSTVEDKGCSSVLSSLLASKISKNEVVLVIGDETYSSCDSIPSWTTFREDFRYMGMKAK